MQQVVEISQDWTYWNGQPNEPSYIMQQRICGDDLLASFAPPAGVVV
jgi:uncharacterized protein (DUF169 family)